MSYPCPTCGAAGWGDHCATASGRDHISRTHLESDVADVRKLVANRDIGFRYVGSRTQLHVWVSDREKRSLTARERRALRALAAAREVEPVAAVGNPSRGAYELRRLSPVLTEQEPTDV